MAGQQLRRPAVPARRRARWQALVLQSLADGMLDAALLARYEEAVRPEALRWAEWRDGQIDKVRTSLQALEPAPQQLTGRVDIGTLSLACALGYLDLRYDAWAGAAASRRWPSGPKASCSGRRWLRSGRSETARQAGSASQPISSFSSISPLNTKPSDS
jgi:glutathione S-transferase